jgi:ATP-binding cassette subfamily F protein 3
VTDRFLLVDGGRVQEFDGDLDDYARWLTRGDARHDGGNGGSHGASMRAGDDGASPPATANPPANASSNTSREAAQQRRREAADQRKALAPLRARLARCDKRLQELAALAKSLDAQLADPALYEAGERARQMDLTTQRARVAQETGEVESEWLTLTDEIERAVG